MALEVSVFRVASGEGDRPSLSYNLYVCNLEEKPFEYLVEYWHRGTESGTHIQPGRFRDVYRTYSPEFGVFVATQGFILRPHETVIMTLRFSAPEREPSEIMGHVRLRLPRVAGTGKTVFRFGAQSDHAVKVLLHAETVSDVQPSISERAGIIDSRGYVWGRLGVSGALSTIRTAVALALASGRAENEIAPDGSFLIDKASIVTLRARAGDTGSGAGHGATGELADADRAAALMELLTQVKDDGDTIAELNKLLESAKLGFRIKPGGRG